jgi:hypothetical protein
MNVCFVPKAGVEYIVESYIAIKGGRINKPPADGLCAER